jgi:hypothetical protein
MNSFGKFTILLLLLAISLSVQGQQFITIGSARPMQNSCILLTPDYPYSEGIAYSRSKLDLQSPFEISFDIYLGNKDEEGADGIAFMIHNDPRQFEAYGTWGEGLGYGRMAPWGNGNAIVPSVAVEFDTYFNIRQNDPQSDHVAYLENGISFHEDFWNGEDPAFNIEDDRLHDFRFRWDPSSKTITVLLDGFTVYMGKKNLIDDIFEGETDVIWGFSASTGRLHNQQYFCLRRLVSIQENDANNFNH